MLDMLEMYLPSIIAVVVACAGAITSVTSLIKVFRTNKDTKDAINITQEGVVKAFREAKLGGDWKVDISKKVDKALADGVAQINTAVQRTQAQLTKLAICNSKILSYTAAYNKLTENEKKELRALLEDLTNMIEVD